MVPRERCTSMLFCQIHTNPYNGTLYLCRPSLTNSVHWITRQARETCPYSVVSPKCRVLIYPGLSVSYPPACLVNADSFHCTRTYLVPLSATKSLRALREAQMLALQPSLTVFNRGWNAASTYLQALNISVLNDRTAQYRPPSDRRTHSP